MAKSTHSTHSTRSTRSTRSTKSKSRASTAKTKSTAQHSISSINGEFWAILVGLFALFIWISLYHPNTTGLLGFWFIETGAKPLLGKTVAQLPLFFAIIALGFFFSYNRRTTILTASSLALVGHAILMEIMAPRPYLSIKGPIQLDGGGWIGALSLYGLSKLIGINGTLILLAGIFGISSILLFNLSIKKTIFAFLKGIINFSDFITQPDTAKRKKTELTGTDVLVELARRLFFSKSPQSQKKQAPKKTQKKPFRDTLQTLLPEPPEIEPTPTPNSQNNTENAPIPLVQPHPPQVTSQKKASPPILEKSQLHQFQLPPLDLLEKGPGNITLTDTMIREKQDHAKALEVALQSFNVDAKVVNITSGPSVTRYELKPGPGVKISKITSLSKDIALKLSAVDVRIEAPIPGKALVGIEVPNLHTHMITLRNIIEETHFYDAASHLTCAIGKTITGESILMDLAKLPHVLIAGATGSGKSVCINTIIMSILLKSSPEDVKFLMIDPKKVELSLYEGIPHLLAPVVTDPNKAAATLKKWALMEMERRYEEFSKVGVKDITGYNKRIEEIIKLNASNEDKAKDKHDRFLFPEGSDPETFFIPKKIPYIVVIIDELADLMMVASQDVESTICRLAQMSRATGIHLVIATQRPSVNVVTGLIKANVPSRISFFLQSQIDSRTILDMAGAEKLLGKGDMLYSPVGSFKPRRVQGVFISEKEVKNIVHFLKKQGSPDYVSDIVDIEPIDTKSGTHTNEEGVDDLFEKAKEIVQNTQYASTSYLQRKLRIGYNRAARIMDELEEKGIITSSAGDKKTRTIL